MPYITCNGRTYWHERADDGGERLVCRDDKNALEVVLEFPAESAPGVAEEIVRTLSDMFLDGFTAGGDAGG